MPAPARSDDGEAPPPRQRPPNNVLALAGAGLSVVLFNLLFRRGGKQKQAKKKPLSRLDASVEEPPPPIQLSFDASVTLRNVPLLQRAHGTARPGRLLGVFGPSGSGKTTLMSLLSGQLVLSKGMRVAGTVSANGAALKSLPAEALGIVRQDDAFFSTLTVRETLLLAARLRLPRRVSWEAKQARVDSLIAQLGLARVQHTRVGGGRVRGISGGERKRLAVACELVVQPSVLLADEPTSGLDSFAALRVVQALKDASRQGRTVVASLHQPRHAIFELLDDVLLLAEGGLMLYCGPARDARGHFKALGIEFPANANPAEVLSDLAAIDHSSPEGESSSRARVHRLADAWSARGSVAEAAAVASGRALAAMAARAPKRNHERLPLWRQFTLLMGRSWKQVMRDGSTLKARLMSALSSAAVFAAIYHKLGRSQAAIQSRLGLLQVVAVNAAMSSMVKTLQLFPVERQIVNRERATGAYSVGPYLLSKLLAELPSALFPSLFGAVVYNSCGLQDGLKSPRFQKFLGVVVLESFTASALGMTVSALVPSAQAALAVGPAIMVPFIVFGGQYVNEETVPQALRWLPKASLIKHAFEAMSVLEFEDLSFEASQPGDAATGQQVLRRCGFQDSSLEQSLSRQVGVLLANWGLTYTLLRARKPRYAVLEAA